MTRYNTMHIAATADYMAEWSDVDDLRRLFNEPDYMDVSSRKMMILGGGSNVLFAEPHYAGTVIRSADTSVNIIDDKPEDVLVRVGAGTKLDDIVVYATERHLWGLENLSLIPGTVGGAAVQNAGAYGAEFGAVVERVICYDCSIGKPVIMPVAKLGYGYRDSIFKHTPAKGRMIIAKVDIRLSRLATPVLEYGRLAEMVAPAGDMLTPADVRRAIIDIRRSKLPDPDTVGSAGSFFRNPVVEQPEYGRFIMRAVEAGYSPDEVPSFDAGDGRQKLSAAWLIDKSGLKGYSRGSVATWSDQPLVIINATCKATGEEVVEMAKFISDTVFKKWGVRLVPEVEYVK